ncbi:MAG: 6-carboxytetrahydropterin synthase QueD [Fibrobacterota bacterium]
MFDVFVETSFSAAHSLVGYEGDCRELHGHNWNVKVTMRCTDTDKIGIAVDFRKIKKTVREEAAGLDHKYLNDIDICDEDKSGKFQNPTSENIARFLFNRLSERLNNETAKVRSVEVRETGSSGVKYFI